MTDSELRYGRRPVILDQPWTEERGRRARYQASRRHELLSCGRHRDPLQHARQAPARVPATFGLELGELRREADRLVGLGWSVDEVLAVLDIAPVSAV